MLILLLLLAAVKAGASTAASDSDGSASSSDSVSDDDNNDKEQEKEQNNEENNEKEQKPYTDPLLDTLMNEMANKIKNEKIIEIQEKIKNNIINANDETIDQLINAGIIKPKHENENDDDEVEENKEKQNDDVTISVKFENDMDNESILLYYYNDDSNDSNNNNENKKEKFVGQINPGKYIDLTTYHGHVFTYYSLSNSKLLGKYIVDETWTGGLNQHIMVSEIQDMVSIIFENNFNDEDENDDNDVDNDDNDNDDPTAIKEEIITVNGGKVETTFKKASNKKKTNTVNKNNIFINVYWYDDETNNEIYQGNIKPGEKLELNTFHGHTYIFKEAIIDDNDVQENVLGDYVINRNFIENNNNNNINNNNNEYGVRNQHFLIYQE